MVEGHPTIDQKRKVQDAQKSHSHTSQTSWSHGGYARESAKVEIFDHDVRDGKFSRPGRGNLFGRHGEIGPLGRPIMEPTQWITGLYNSGIMNLLDIPHLGVVRMWDYASKVLGQGTWRYPMDG
jgi:hypothetical protein